MAANTKYYQNTVTSTNKTKQINKNSFRLYKKDWKAIISLGSVIFFGITFMILLTNIMQNKMNMLDVRRDQVAKIKKGNDMLKEKINSQTSVKSLQDFASDYGMSSSQSNVSNISK
ncbi:MAG: hypothetical protein LBC17_04320 [Lactobacillaceae bacterium]|jgi:cell division protein FtsL|nr:hypothetical protein [Lactobacillaceae bacterium]